MTIFLVILLSIPVIAGVYFLFSLETNKLQAIKIDPEKE